MLQILHRHRVPQVQRLLTHLITSGRIVRTRILDVPIGARQICALLYGSMQNWLPKRHRLQVRRLLTHQIYSGQTTHTRIPDLMHGARQICALLYGGMQNSLLTMIVPIPEVPKCHRL